jgi:hypothetical protein
VLLVCICVVSLCLCCSDVICVVLCSVWTTSVV